MLTDKKKGRESDQEITLFDSVGFAIEDFAVLKLIHALCEKNNIGKTMDLIPELDDPKNLFGMLNQDSGNSPIDLSATSFPPSRE